MDMKSLLKQGSSLIQAVEHRFDDDTIDWKAWIIGFIIAEYLFEEYLSYRQYRILKRTVVPQALKGVVSQEDYDKSQAYSRAKAKFGLVASAYRQAINLIILYYDLMPYFWDLTRKWQETYFGPYFQGELFHSVLFIFGGHLPVKLLDLPFNLYQTFVLEQKYGFNKQTYGLFFKDLVLTEALSIVIGAPLLVAFLKIIDYFGKQTFAFYVMIFLLVVQVVMIAIYPVLIQPLFNKLEPLKDGVVKTKTEELARKLKFPLGKLWVIDGSKRSAHSNAYFYGLPWSKQIVLFDTLIEQSEPMEVVAVLAHELGHWANWDTTRQLVIGEAYLSIFFFCFSAFIENGSLFRAFGFMNEKPALIGFLLFNDVWQPIDHVIKWVMHFSSRRNEYGADKFAKDLGYTDELARALIKLQVKNLSAMDADWLYSAYNHSHPILTERLRALDYKGKPLSDEKMAVNGKVE